MKKKIISIVSLIATLFVNSGYAAIFDIVTTNGYLDDAVIFRNNAEALCVLKLAASNEVLPVKVTALNTVLKSGDAEGEWSKKIQKNNQFGVIYFLYKALSGQEKYRFKIEVGGKSENFEFMQKVSSKEIEPLQLEMAQAFNATNFALISLQKDHDEIATIRNADEYGVKSVVTRKKRFSAKSMSDKETRKNDGVTIEVTEKRIEKKELEVREKLMLERTYGFSKPKYQIIADSNSSYFAERLQCGPKYCGLIITVFERKKPFDRSGFLTFGLSEGKPLRGEKVNFLETKLVESRRAVLKRESIDFDFRGPIDGLSKSTRFEIQIK